MFPKALGLWDCRASATLGGPRSSPGSAAPLEYTGLHSTGISVALPKPTGVE